VPLVSSGEEGCQNGSIAPRAVLARFLLYSGKGRNTAATKIKHKLCMRAFRPWGVSMMEG
jgi:hypothetical protein